MSEQSTVSVSAEVLLQVYVRKYQEADQANAVLLARLEEVTTELQGYKNTEAADGDFEDVADEAS